MEDFSLQKLISQIKRELLSDSQSPEYPIFLIEKVELEVAISIKTEGKGGVSIQVVELGAGISKEHCNTVKITLSPILSRDEQLQFIKSDDRLRKGIERASKSALIKGNVELAGEPE